MATLTDKAIRAAESGRLQDGQGLMLEVRASGSKFWLLRVMKDGKRSEIGLGAYPAVSLAQARQDAQALRVQVKGGRDVVAERRQERAEQLAANDRTFEKVARLLHQMQTFGTEKLKAAWLYRLEAYAFPHFGHVPVDKVDGPAVLLALGPIWLAKPETARRVRQLVGAVLRFAHVKGWRGPSPTLSDFTKDGLPKQSVGPVHRPAVEYSEAPAIVARLYSEAATMGRQALLFAVLTAARSGEVRLATWGEIDLERALWSIPAARMKMKREHVVPLSAPAVALLRARLEQRAAVQAGDPQPGEIVFASERASGALSDMTLLKVQKRVSPETVPHGWRSTFRDWAAETTSHQSDVCEAALAHQLGTAVTRSYQRGSLLDKRRALMEDWAAYLLPVAKPEAATDAGADIISLANRRKGAA